MNSVITIIIAVISSSVVAAVISAVMQKRSEKESRLFNAKLEAYKEFAAHLESRFVSLMRSGKNLDIITLAEVSAKCLLVSNLILNKELKTFLAYVSKVYQRCSSSDYDEKSEGHIFDKVWNDADRIESLMREDLGFR